MPYRGAGYDADWTLKGKAFIDSHKEGLFTSGTLRQPAMTQSDMLEKVAKEFDDEFGNQPWEGKQKHHTEVVGDCGWDALVGVHSELEGDNKAKLDKWVQENADT